MRTKLSRNAKAKDVNLKALEEIRHEYWGSRRRHSHSSTRLRIL